MNNQHKNFFVLSMEDILVMMLIQLSINKELLLLMLFKVKLCTPFTYMEINVLKLIQIFFVNGQKNKFQSYQCVHCV